MLEQLEGLLDTWGYAALLIGTFLEGETILILAGIAASKGLMNVHASILCAFIGSFLGDQTVFYLSRYKSEWMLKRFSKFQKNLERALLILEKYSVWILLSFRFFYGLRNVVSIAAGLSKVSKVKFGVYNGIGAFVWSLAFGYGGFFLGKALVAFIEDAKSYQVYIIVGLVVAAVLFFILKSRKNRISADQK